MEKITSCDPLQALNDAMCREEEARDFYLKAAGLTGNASGKKMFHSLANEAGRQVELLEEQLAGLTEDNTWTLPECILACQFDVEAAPYPQDQASLEREIGPDTSDVEAILYAMRAESANYVSYVKQAQATTDEQAHQFYAYLAEQANTRLDLLMLNFDSTEASAALGD